jgi:hypothetical protein
MASYHLRSVDTCFEVKLSAISALLNQKIVQISKPRRFASKRIFINCKRKFNKYFNNENLRADQWDRAMGKYSWIVLPKMVTAYNEGNWEGR